MRISAFDHVSLAVIDLDRSIAFYRDVLGLHPIQRSPFRRTGAWMAAGGLELHLTVNPEGNFRRSSRIDTADIHFAARVPDFAAAMRHLAAKGYSEDAPDGDPQRLVTRFNGPTGYPQAYLMDPDRHLIEINGAGAPGPRP
ncbi:MAG: VOC family protein [Rhizobiales bacterium]|nr:VOC family protein [Hyphomicrobiales bacterium]MBI3672483.1 VOC family protein [Hyphomicrobiales bacterium]